MKTKIIIASAFVAASATLYQVNRQPVEQVVIPCDPVKLEATTTLIRATTSDCK